VLDRSLLARAFGVLGATEAVLSMTAFAVVLVSGGWGWGETPPAGLLAVASGTAFATISMCQMANAFACRSGHRPVWALPPRNNPFLVAAVLTELLLLLVFLGVPLVSDTLGGAWPEPVGWVMAVAAAGLLVLVDAAAKAAGNRRHPTPRAPAVTGVTGA